MSNSDDDLMRMLNGEFNRFTASRLDLYPEALRADIDEMNTFLYERVNNGVYRAGFATPTRLRTSGSITLRGVGSTGHQTQPTALSLRYAIRRIRLATLCHPHPV